MGEVITLPSEEYVVELMEEAKRFDPDSIVTGINLVAVEKDNIHLQLTSVSMDRENVTPNRVIRDRENVTFEVRIRP